MPVFGGVLQAVTKKGITWAPDGAAAPLTASADRQSDSCTSVLLDINVRDAFVAPPGDLRHPHHLLSSRSVLSIKRKFAHH
jgi:hypothetical protein